MVSQRGGGGREGGRESILYGPAYYADLPKFSPYP